MNQSGPTAHDDAAAYALNALDNVERARFERHLDACVDCQNEVADYQQTLRQVATSAPPVAPSPSLKTNLMTQVGETAQLGQVRPARRREPSPRTRVENIRKPVYAAFAAAAALLGFGVIAMHPWTTPTTTTISAAQRVEQAPDAATVKSEYKGGHVTVTRSASLGSTLVVTRDLPALPADKIYQVWAIKGATPTSIGTISAKGSAVFPPPPSGTASMAVTVEPAGGSPKPTTKPILTLAV